MTPQGLTRRFVFLRALRWLPIGLVLPFLILTPDARGLPLSAIGLVFAVHSAVAIVLEIPSGALADSLGRRRMLLAGAFLTAASLALFALAQSTAAFMLSLAVLAAGRAFVSGALEAWYVDSLRLLDPTTPLAQGLSRGTAAEGAAMATGALLGGALVTLSAPGSGAGGALSGYGLAATTGSLAALLYLAAIAKLVDEPAVRRPGRALSGARMHQVLTIARYQASASLTVRVVLMMGFVYGISFAAVELLWQPQLADLLGRGHADGLVFGALAAASMAAVALGATLSPRVRRRVSLRVGYPVSLALVGLSIALMGAPQVVAAFAAIYLLTYFGAGIAEPMHYELLNDAIGPEARATLISAESLATQTGGLLANLGVGAPSPPHKAPE